MARYNESSLRSFVSLFPLSTGVVSWFLLFSVVCAISLLLMTPAVVFPGIVLGLIALAFLITAVYIGVMLTLMLLSKGAQSKDAQSQAEPQPSQSDNPSTDHKWQVLTYLAMLGTGLLLVGLCVGALYAPALVPFTVALFAVGAAMGIHGVGLIVFTAFFAFVVGALIGLMSSATMYFVHIPLAAHYLSEDALEDIPDKDLTISLVLNSYFNILMEELGHAKHAVFHSAPVSAVGEGLGIVGTLFASCASVCCDEEGASPESNHVSALDTQGGS